MAYPGGYSSEDEFDGFLSDNSEYDEPGRPEVRNDHPQAVELTLEQKLNNLFFAIMNGALTEVILATNEGIDVNVELRDGWSPILLAASIGNAEIVLELINRGANVNSDRDKYTPLMAVCSCPDSTSPGADRLQIINALIDHGANIEAITRKRQRAIMYAASNGNVEVLARLITVCNTNAEDNQGWTALFWAVNNNKLEAVQLLLDTGLSPYKLDIRGNNAVHYAVTQDFDDTVKLLSVQADDTIPSIHIDLYDIEEMFKELSPQFFWDISNLLHGMQCAKLVNYFTNVDLLQFLSLDNRKLEELGIELPYQRYKILASLHKFHQHLYKQKSIPIIPKDALYSTIDVGNALMVAVRQLIAMEASIKYISRIDASENPKPLEICIKTIRMRLQKIKMTAKALTTRTREWDSQIQAVDLISSNATRKRSRRWFKYVGCVSILTFTVIVFSRTTP